LQAAGVEVEVATSAYRGGGNREFAGIPVHRFRYSPARWETLTHDEAAPDRMKRSWRYRVMAVCYVLAGAVAVWRLCRRRRFDIVHVHWPFPHALFGWMARRAGAGAVVTTFYGVELRWVKGSMPFFRRFLAWAARSSDRVVAISSYTAGEIAELAPVPIEVIPYTVALPRAEHREIKPAGRPFTVLFVGRLVDRKGVEYLIEALGLLPDRLAARLEVVGEGPARAGLERLARRSPRADAIEFRGRITQAALQQAYAGADLFVLPSVVDRRGDTEGLGVVLLEAMNERVPVIASAIGGITDIVSPGETGLLVPPADAPVLAAAILRVADDPALARSLADRAYQRLQEHFSWPGIVGRWLELYGGLVAAKER
ncbi:MAG: glycosyltransferase family 4 protein, partial [Gemmatimonadales bacterium]